jgi:GT2 family glycosyltransferase
MALSWGLTIATYNRADCLRSCVGFAMSQVRMPVEVVIVDGSDDWQTSRDAILREFAERHPEIAWTYERATVRSLPHQRNQGLRLAKADILFMIDDDSFMYPDCAAEIMRIYDLDAGKKIAGIMAVLAPSAPDAPQTNGGGDGAPRSRMLDARQKVFDLLSTLYMDKLVQPYDATYPDKEIPPEVRGTGAFRSRTLHGMRMTYRREVIAKEGFSEALLRYAANEDVDASYRVSRHGALLVAPRARLHHAESKTARLTRYTRTVLGLTNYAYLYKINGHDPDSLLRRMRSGIRRRMVVDAIGDLVGKRWSFPRVRGDIDALKTMSTIQRSDRDKLAEWYTNFQVQMLERNPA